jgi:hypothetical protein
VVVGAASPPPEFPQAPAASANTTAEPVRHFLTRTMIPPFFGSPFPRTATRSYPKDPAIPNCAKSPDQAALPAPRNTHLRFRVTNRTGDPTCD